MKNFRKVVPIILLAVFIVMLGMHLLQHNFLPKKGFREKYKCSDAHLITVFEGGKLGNNIWEYMSLYATTSLLKRHKMQFITFCPVLLKAKVEYVFERLSIATYSEISSTCFNQHTLYVLPLNESIDFSRLNHNRSIVLVLAKYSARYKEIIENGIENIKKELRFRRKYIEHSHKTLSKIKEMFKMLHKNVTFVGMHYRGTNYIHFLKRNYHNTFNGPSNFTFYEKAMNYFEKKYKHVIFIFITIDLGWLAENLPLLRKRNSKLVVNPNNKDCVRDLVLLSHCNHSIVNYGTFGVTSALFAGGTTFVYDLGIPLDHRGPTVAMGMADLLPNWHLLK